MRKMLYLPKSSYILSTKKGIEKALGRAQLSDATDIPSALDCVDDTSDHEMRPPHQHQGEKISNSATIQLVEPCICRLMEVKHKPENLPAFVTIHPSRRPECHTEY